MPSTPEARRERRKAEKQAREEAVDEALQHALSYPADATGAIQWIEKTLIVPFGPRIGKPFTLDLWQTAFIHNALSPSVREAGLSVARKNGKTATVAALCLAYLVGPLNREELRIICGSLSLEHVGELQMAIRQTAEASGLEVEVLKTPRPGHIIGRRGARCNFLSSSNDSGHSVAADVAIFDELGLVPENKRQLIANFRSACSGRNGRFVALSIQGFSPLFAEMKELSKSNPKIYFQEHMAPNASDAFDEASWHAANPGLASGIKSLQFMKDTAEIARNSPSEEYFFRTLHMNEPGQPDKESVVRLDDWRRCIADVPRAGRCVVGIDIGGANAMSGAAMLWESGRLEVFGIFPGEPSLIARGRSDGVGTRYHTEHARGELQVQHGRRSVDVAEFVATVAAAVGDYPVSAVVADRFKMGEVEDALRICGLRWRRVWRGMGFRDGSADVTAFQRQVLDASIHAEDSLIMASAIADSAIERDPAGNLKLVKGRSLGKIDVLSAGILAAGEMARLKAKPKASFAYAGAI